MTEGWYNGYLGTRSTRNVQLRSFRAMGKGAQQAVKFEQRDWVLSYGTGPDSVTMVFASYIAAVRQLADELWWGYEDTGDDELMVGWEEVGRWLNGVAINRYVCGYRLEVKDPTPEETLEGAGLG